MPYKDREKQKQAQRASYERNRVRILDRQRRNRDEINLNRVNLRRRRQQMVSDIKQERGCERCSRRLPPCLLDFHHRDPSEKEARVSLLVNDGVAEDAIFAEIAKCDVICVVCHRLEHTEQTDEVREFKDSWC